MPEARGLKVASALLLTFVAGYVDIVGYVSVYHLFTAHMTGTTVHLGRDLATGAWTAAALAGSVVAGFVGGSVAGRAVIEAGARLGLRRVATVTIAMESALVLAFMITVKMISAPAVSWGTICVLLLMLAVAMGLQTATLTRIGPLTVHTTFVTGMLNKMSQLLSHALFHSYDWLKAEPGGRTHFEAAVKVNLREALFFFCIWALYLSGAVIGTWSQARWGTDCLYVAIVILGGAIVLDQISAFSLQEEKDQSEL